MSHMHIYIVDDNTEYRSSTAWWLHAKGYKVQDFPSGDAFLDWAKDRPPVESECLLLDVRMPNISGLELHEELKISNIYIPIIYMTGHADIPVAVEAMKKGAITYLQKPLDEKQLEQALDAAFISSRLTPSENIAEDNMPSIKPQPCSADRAAFQRRLATLTKRENEVLEGVVAGKMNKVLAFDLGISIKTVEIHRAQIRNKMRARNSAELIRMVVSESIGA